MFRFSTKHAGARLKRWGLGLNLLLAALFALAIWGMLNFLSSRHYTRLTWSSTPHTPLSVRTRQLLNDPAGTLRITAMIRPGNPAAGRTAALLREFATSSPRVSLEQINPDINLARAEELTRLYRLPDEECVVLDIEGNFRTIPVSRLWQTVEEDVQPRYQGETVLTAALVSLTWAERASVYFTRGHGERSPDDYDRRSGFSRIAERLRDENLTVASINLVETRAVPADCALLIVAAPIRAFTPFELSLVKDYLNRKGRLLLLLDARTETGFDDLLREWGVQIGDDIVVDGGRTLGGRELYITAYPSHPIVDPLKTLATVFFLPRSIRPIAPTSGADRPLVQNLASSSVRGWAEFSPDENPPRFDETIDIRGPVPIAVAIERGPVPGVHIQIRPTRIVVIGDSSFASNGGLMAANADFFLNAANWLLERDNLIATLPRQSQHTSLIMDAHQLQRLFWILVAVLPALYAIIGIGITWRRRSRA